ncbi:MAG TPA: MFS transporter [Streptosporangiaceae bacterium]|nr:MFS transporter [Streptosporangiaceae bacterium]
MRRLLAIRDARLYIGGQTLSAIGDSSLWLAMGVWVKILTGSNSDGGLVIFAFTCGLVLAPACGLLADRLPRKPLLIAVNLASAALVCTLLLVHGAHDVWLIYVVMFLYGAGNALISSAQTALLAVLIPDDLLGEANMLLQVGTQGTRIFTPLIGAGLLAWVGAQPVVLLDAATFVAAAVTIMAVRFQEQPAPARTDWKGEFLAGWRYIGQTPILRRLLVTFVIALAVFGFMETICFAVVSQGLHRPPTFLGVLVAVLAAGSIAGAILAAPLMEWTSERATVAGALVTCAIACLLFTSGILAVALTACALLGACLAGANVAATTLLQRRTPPELLGRVDAALTLGSTLPQALSIAIGAALVAVVDYRILLLVMAAVTLAAAAYLLSGRNQGQPAPGPAAPPNQADVPLTAADA